MRKILLSIFFLLLSFTPNASLFAADPAPQASPATQDPAQKAAMARSQEIVDFYKKDAAFRRESFEKRIDLLKQINELRKKQALSKDENEKKNVASQVIVLEKQMDTLNEETAKQELVLAEFSVKQSQERLERAKKRLAEVQQKKA